MNVFDSIQGKESVLFENRYYTKKEVARKLSISVKTNDVMMASGRINFIKLGRAVRFNGSKLNE